ncbi:hypothetical protein M0802_006016 [Mischocyttarus mexicanus]|nr:hypothetical protein M0802_006016 [Mischocyttarus mexicanus]
MDTWNNLPSSSQQIFQAPQCTPRLTFTVEREEFLDNEITFSQDIISLTWNVFGVSALFGFQYNDKTNLKLYGKRLREEVATNLSNENETYNANISIVGDTVTDVMYQPFIKVEVYAKKLDKDENKEKCIYKGYFLSWKKNNDLGTNNTTRLPLLICRGTRPCMNIVHSTFSRMFDCLIIELPIEQDDLIWLLAIIILPVEDDKNSKNSKKNIDVKLEFTVPGLPINNTINVEFKRLDLVNILNAIIENEDDDIATDVNLTIEQIQRFRKCLYMEIKQITGLEVGLCYLHRISLAPATIMCNKMKIMDPYRVKRILSYMTEKSVDMFHAFL